MTIYSYLKKDHKLVKNLINKIENLSSHESEKRNSLFNQLKTEIIIHSKAEDNVFYSSLKKKSATKEEIPHAKEEHAEVEEMLEKLSDNSLNGAAWNQLFKKMTIALLHHIDEEENEIFPDAKKELSSEEAQQMEIAMQEEKKRVEKKIDISGRE